MASAFEETFTLRAFVVLGVLALATVAGVVLVIRRRRS